MQAENLYKAITKQFRVDRLIDWLVFRVLSTVFKPDIECCLQTKYHPFNVRTNIAALAVKFCMLIYTKYRWFVLKIMFEFHINFMWNYMHSRCMDVKRLTCRFHLACLVFLWKLRFVGWFALTLSLLNLEVKCSCYISKNIPFPVF